MKTLSDVNKSVEKSVWDCFGEFVWNSTGSSVKKSVWDSVRISVWEPTWTSAGQSVRDSVKDSAPNKAEELSK